MLEKVDLTKKLSKEEYKEKMEHLEVRLGQLQRRCKELGIPVLIVLKDSEPREKAFRSVILSRVWTPEDFRCFRSKTRRREERMHPFMWRFWTKTPARGRIAIFDGSWYRRVLIDRFEKRTKEKEIPDAFHSINSLRSSSQMTEM